MEDLSMLTFGPPCVGETSVISALIEDHTGRSRPNEQELASQLEKLQAYRTLILEFTSHVDRDNSTSIVITYDEIEMLSRTLRETRSERPVIPSDIWPRARRSNLTNQQAILALTEITDGNHPAPNPTQWGTLGPLAESAIADARRPRTLNNLQRLETRVRRSKSAVHVWAAALVKVVDYAIALVRAKVVVIKVALPQPDHRQFYALALIAISMHHRHGHEPEGRTAPVHMPMSTVGGVPVTC